MCATWRSCVTCGTCPLCIIFYKFGHRMPVPGRFAGCHRTSDAGSGRFAGCHRTSVAGSGPVRRIPPDVGSPPDVGCRLQPVCRMPSDIRSRFRPVRQMPPVRWMPVRRYTAGRRMPSAGCHRNRSLSDSGPPVATGTHHRRMPATGHHRMPGHRSGSSAPPVRCRMLCATGPVLVCQKPLHGAR